MSSDDIYNYGREIVSYISQNDIPYTDHIRCREFSLSYTFPSWSMNKGEDLFDDFLRWSHVDISWQAQPKKGSSIIWSNLKRIKTSELNSILKSIKRDKKIETILIN